MSDLLYPRAARTTARPLANPERWVDIHRAAEHLGVTVRWLYGDADRNGVPCSRIGRQRRYLLSRLTAWAVAREGVAA